MKNILIAMLFASALFACEKEVAQEDTMGVEAVSTDVDKEIKSYAAFNFNEKVHDFGTINAGEVVSHTFNFTNTGQAPLIITDIKTTCGCTTPNYTKTPIQPGETGEIVVQFNSSGKSGVQNKDITIYANTEGSVEKIMIKTNVQPAAGGPV